MDTFPAGILKSCKSVSECMDADVLYCRPYFYCAKQLLGAGDMATGFSSGKDVWFPEIRCFSRSSSTDKAIEMRGT